MSAADTAHALATTREQYARWMSNVALHALDVALRDARTLGQRLAAVETCAFELERWGAA